MITKAIDQLTSCAERKEIEDALRHIAEIVLKDYILKFGETFVQLIEIEMYYYNESCYKDTAIHKSEQQRHRYGKVYVHPSGFDICLSDSDDYYLSFLVRSARVGNTKVVTSGPINVREAIKRLGVDLEKDLLELIATPVNPHVNVYFATRKGLGKSVIPEDNAAMLSAALGVSGKMLIPSGFEKYAYCELKRRNVHDKETADALSREIIGGRVAGIKEFYQ